MLWVMVGIKQTAIRAMRLALCWRVVDKPLIINSKASKVAPNAPKIGIFMIVAWPGNELGLKGLEPKAISKLSITPSSSESMPFGSGYGTVDPISPCAMAAFETMVRGIISAKSTDCPSTIPVTVSERSSLALSPASALTEKLTAASSLEPGAIDAGTRVALADVMKDGKELSTVMAS